MLLGLSILSHPLFTRRDNRLSSLQGLSGLPDLRELRLDINHLTSLHELKNLPSLVELSANTNHIRVLPEGFAAGLMPPKFFTQNWTKLHSTSGRATVACGRLQKLELYHNRLSSVHPKALEGLVSLTHLDLGRNQLKTLNGQALEACPALSTLVLSQNLLREPPYPLRLPLLNELWLSGNQINSMGAWAFAPLQVPASGFISSNLEGRTTLETTFPAKLNDAPPGLNMAPTCQSRKSDEGRGTSAGLELVGQVALYGATTKRERDKTSTNGAGRIDAEDGGVWLPSLEKLHLQDNELETLGGPWSLVGCPLLRSFDASFNKLRTPNNFFRCLEACGELEEVRLHDNPASDCADYADSVALCCPRVSQGIPSTDYLLCMCD